MSIERMDKLDKKFEDKCAELAEFTSYPAEIEMLMAVKKIDPTRYEEIIGYMHKITADHTEKQVEEMYRYVSSEAYLLTKDKLIRPVIYRQRIDDIIEDNNKFDRIESKCDQILERLEKEKNTEVTDNERVIRLPSIRKVSVDSSIERKIQALQETLDNLNEFHLETLYKVLENHIEKRKDIQSSVQFILDLIETESIVDLSTSNLNRMNLLLNKLIENPNDKRSKIECECRNLIQRVIHSKK